MKSLFSLLFITCVSATSAQTVFQSLKPQMVKDWERAKDYTLEYLNTMPADKYNYRPNDSVRSFSEQMLHLAVADAALVMIGTGSKDPKVPAIFMSRNIEKVPSAQTKDSVVYFVTTSYDFVINTLKNQPDLRFDEVVTQQMPAAVRSETRLAWLQKAFEHQTHHRGQCTVYIRMQGIKPPGEKLF
jgi:uncharacterized damage-inducible protein DinB